MTTWGLRVSEVYQHGEMHGKKTIFTFVSGKIDLVFFVAGKPCGEGVSYSKDHKKAWLLVDGKKVRERP